MAIERNTSEFATLRAELGELISRNTVAIENLGEELVKEVTDRLEMKVSVQADFSELERRLGERFDAAAERTEARFRRIQNILLGNVDRLARIETRLDAEFASFGKGVESLVAAVERLEDSIDSLESTATELRNAVVELTAEVRRRPR